MSQLEDRVAALEKSVRGWRIVASALGVVLLAALGIAAAPGGKLEAPAVQADRQPASESERPLNSSSNPEGE